MSEKLEFTGERFVPGTSGEIWYEHWHRYHFAASLVAGRKVLDVACGEGYGSALLSRHAASVVGVDLAPQAIAYARTRYADHRNVAYTVANCTALPFPNAGFDALVSFETVEHIGAQEAFLDEVRRVLQPDGVLVLSCPNKREYSDRRGTVNPFHVRELYRDELAELVRTRFAHVAWYGQQPGFFSVIFPEAGDGCAEVFEVSESNPLERSPGHAHPLYFLLLASAHPDALANVPPRVSVLADADEWVRHDYEKVTRDLDAAHRRGNALEAQVAAAERALRQALRQASTEAQALRATIAARDASIAAAEAWRTKLERDIEALNAALRSPPGLRSRLASIRRRLGAWGTTRD